MNLKSLETEQRNPNTRSIDSMTTAGILEAINREDAGIAAAVNQCLPQLTQLVDEICARLEQGGRLIYIGAGTSGRLGVLDASECPPTYGVSPELVQGIIAGGDRALRESSEGAEDNAQAGADDLRALGISQKDAVVGLAASGRTPYVIGALDYADSVGAYTGAVSCVSGAEMSRHAKTVVEAVTGPEAVTGSTRMKAGTAQKMILNMISTSVMIKMGKVYQNLMVDVQPTYEKLVIRSINIIRECLDCGEERAAELLKASGRCVKLAVLMGLTGLEPEPAKQRLEQAGGRLRSAIDACTP